VTNRDNSGVSGVDYIGVGVGGIILGDSGQVLLSQRGPKARNRVGQWENPGGTIEFGEEFDTAIVREISEELGIEVRVEGVLRVVNHIIPDESQHWVAPTFVCRHVAGTPVIREPDKCTAIGWFDLSDLPEPLAEISHGDLMLWRQVCEGSATLHPVDWCRSDASRGQ
jgi:8-oxo-dGTP diphosphatase